MADTKTYIRVGQFEYEIDRRVHDLRDLTQQLTDAMVAPEPVVVSVAVIDDHGDSRMMYLRGDQLGGMVLGPGLVAKPSEPSATPPPAPPN